MKGLILIRLSDVISYATKRFEALYTPPFSLICISNKKKKCLCVYLLGQYGVKELISIVHHESFSFLFSEEGRAVVVSQWSLFKTKVRHLIQLPLVDIYLSVIVEDKQAKNIPVICKVIEITMTLSPSTASCERGFSSQNIVKT